MSLTAILPSVQTLSRQEKFRLVQMLVEEPAGEATLPLFPEGQIYPIHTPAYAPDAAFQLAQVLEEPQGGTP